MDNQKHVNKWIKTGIVLLTISLPGFVNNAAADAISWIQYGNVHHQRYKTLYWSQYDPGSRWTVRIEFRSTVFKQPLDRTM